MADHETHGGRLTGSAPSEDEIAALFTGECRFLVGAASGADFPPHDDVEVAFAGRSNVGKSSLLNALVGRKALARTAKSPGRTRELNFFLLAGREKRIVLVDLPGYGFARAPKTAVARWTELTRTYLSGRPQLRRVFLLIDSRHGVKESDAQMMGLLNAAAVNFQVVLTKADKLSAGERPDRARHIARTLKAHPAAYPEVLMTSAPKGVGIEALRAEIARLAGHG